MNIDPMDARFMTEAEIARELGITTAEFKAALPELTAEGFPAAHPLYAKRRYWPAVKIFLDWRYNLADNELLSANQNFRRLSMRHGKIEDQE